MFSIYRKEDEPDIYYDSRGTSGLSAVSCMFNLYLQQIMPEALEDFEGTVSVGGRKMNNFRFADDIDLLGRSKEELTDLTRRLDRIATAYGMEISEEKSKVLRMGAGANPSDISVAGGKLDTVKTLSI